MAGWDFEVEYPYATQAECRDAIRLQELKNHYASGGRRDGVDRWKIAEWDREPRAKPLTAVEKSESDKS